MPRHIKKLDVSLLIIDAATLSVTTLWITTPSIVTFGKTTLSIRILIKMPLSITIDTHNYDVLIVAYLLYQMSLYFVSL